MPAGPKPPPVENPLSTVEVMLNAGATLVRDVQAHLASRNAILGSEGMALAPMFDEVRYIVTVKPATQEEIDLLFGETDEESVPD